MVVRHYVVANEPGQRRPDPVTQQKKKLPVRLRVALPGCLLAKSSRGIVRHGRPIPNRATWPYVVGRLDLVAVGQVPLAANGLWLAKSGRLAAVDNLFFDLATVVPGLSIAGRT